MRNRRQSSGKIEEAQSAEQSVWLLLILISFLLEKEEKE